MKKIFVCLLCAVVLTNVASAQKAFEKGNISFTVAVGLAGYKTSSHYEYDMQYWNGSGFSTVRVTEDTSDGAVAMIVPLTVEYGITNWLGLGGRFGYHKYFTGADTSNSGSPTVKSLDADLLLGLHLIKTKHLDLPINVFVGYSSFSYYSNDKDNNAAKDGGMTFGLELNPKIYFGNHVGISFNAGYASVSYKSMTFSNSSDSNINEGRLYQLKGSGLNLGMGLVVKF